MYLKDFFVFLERIALHDIEICVFLCVSSLSSHPRYNFLSECIIRRYRFRRFQNLRKFTQIIENEVFRFDAVGDLLAVGVLVSISDAMHCE